MSDVQVRGPLYGTSGTPVPFTGDITGAQRVTDAHGRFQEAALRGFLFSTGMTLTSISNATFTTGTLGATCTPIVGIWNPMNSGKNAVVLQARLSACITAATATGPGGFVWASAVNQSAISTGLTPWSRLSLAQSGSVCKGFANTALTGLSGNLSIMEAAGVSGGPIGNFSMVGTAAGFVTPNAPASIDLIDGAFIVPPGGVLALLCSTTATAVSAASSLLWEEVPILP